MKLKLSAVLVAAALVGSASGAAAFPRIVTDLAAFRSGPGLGFLPVLAIPPQTVVNVRGHIGGWSKVEFGGTTGYIASSLLAKPIIAVPAVVAPVAVPVAVPPPAAPVGLIAAPLPIEF